MSEDPVDRPIGWGSARDEPRLVDPSDTAPFNPLDTRNLAIAVAKALLEKHAWPLGNLSAFHGAGIYAIYYHGPFSAYAAVAAANCVRERPRWPVYVGKAVPAGTRRGETTLAATAATRALRLRLGQHAESIRAVSNLNLDDFSCRFLIVQDLWIPLAEAMLISHFAPVWNKLVDGFGNHDPGAGRRAGLRPRWDVLHPGRAWANRCANRLETAEDITREVVAFTAGASVPGLEAPPTNSDVD